MRHAIAHLKRRLRHRRFASLDIQPRRVLAFVGAPRMGTTLVGQLLNYHPHCLIATESRLIQNVVARGSGFESELRRTAKLAYRSFVSGLENDREYAGAMARFQPRWKPMGDLARDPALAKSTVRVVGDKKAGGTTQTWLDGPEAMRAFIAGRPELVLLQIVRDPIASAVSMLKSHPHQAGDFDEACETIVRLSAAGAAMRQAADRPDLCIAYEELLADPPGTLGRIVGWLDLPCEPGWLEAATGIINGAGASKPTTEAQRRSCARLIAEYRAEALFARYG